MRYSSLRLLTFVAVMFVYLSGFSLSDAGAISYNACLQDDSSGYTVRINSTTGDYKFKRCSDGFTVTGQGTITSRGSTFTLQQSGSDRRVQATWMTGGAGNASLQMPPGTTVLTIMDRSTINNNCGS